MNMKKFFTILTLMCLTALTSFAQNFGSLFKVRHQDGRRIAIEIDGRAYPNRDRVVAINNLPSGNHRIRVYVMNGNRTSLVYNGRVRTRNGYIYRCTVSPFAGMDVQEYCCVNNNGSFNNGNNINGYNHDDHDWDDHYWGDNNNGWNNGNNGNGGYIDPNGNNGNGGWNNNNNGNGGWNNNNNNGNGGWSNGNNNGGTGYWGTPNSCMNNSNFEAFKQTVARSKFDSGRMDIVKAQMTNAWISAAQLRDLVNLFTFESSKLDMAKFGAVHVVDRQNLFMIYDAFTFESSKTEFAQVIANLR
jgi:hypothetical protein